MYSGEWYLRQENFAQALNSFERHLQFLQKQPGPPTPAGKSEIAAVHKKVGSLYTHLYTSTSTFLDDASANAATEAPVTNIDQLQQKQKQRQEEYLEKAAAHYLEAMKGGIYDVEIRRFFAHHAPTTAQVNATASATSANETVEISFKEPAEIDELGMSEQEILQQLQGFEPHGATDAERISSDKRARRTEKGSNEKESATRPTARTGASTRSRSVTASAAATVTVATGALHRRRSRWVVRHLSAAPLTSIDAVEHVPTSLLTLQKSTTITSAALPEEEEDLQSTFTGGLRAHDSTTGGSLEVEMRRVVDAAEAEGTETPFEVQRRRQEELQASEDVLNVQ